MQTLVAYAFAAGNAPPQATARLVWQADAVARVQGLESERWAHGPRFAQAHSPNAGVLLWESEASPSRWPAWCTSPRGVVVASVYAPLGYAAVTGSTPLERAPLELADALVAAPARMFEITPPFVLTRLDPEADTIDLFTDVLGVGRLFELATSWGWVWSNRAAAALKFAGRRAAADAVGWAQSAVADEFFGSVTPYEGVRAIDAATRIHVDGRSGRRLDTAADTVATWSGVASSTPELRRALAEQAAAALRIAAASVTTLYGVTPTVDLSGGRDSRIVAAAFLSSGGQVRLHSHDAVPGDLTTATELVRMLRERVPGTEHVAPATCSVPEHLVEHRATGGVAEPPALNALESARHWHAYADGLRPCTFIAHAAPPHLDADPSLVVGGVGGELAHGFFYPGDLEALQALPLARRLSRFAATVLARQGPVPGAGAQARSELLGHIRGVLGAIADRGFTDGRALDVYYMRERLRRWGSTAERVGVVSPLLSPSFVAAALSLTPEDRRLNTLHRNIVRELIPAWADVPFFPAEAMPPVPGKSASPPIAPRVLRLADAADAGDVAALLADPATWGHGFDVPTVHRYWHASREGATTAREERVLRSAVWRGTFADMLADLNDEPRPMRSSIGPPAPAVPRSALVTGPAATTSVGPSRPGLAVRVRRRTAAKALARTRMWAAVRDTAIGAIVRRVLRS